ncbi:MAG TPA: hypothetical protein VLC08_11110 [Chitinolyticbacter sp.]|nr:hypothetical protein [Chitinolyticbacter sp.]
MIAAALRMLGVQELPAARPVAIVNEFQASQKSGNFFRPGTAVIGAPGCAIDPCITLPQAFQSLRSPHPAPFPIPG